MGSFPAAAAAVGIGVGAHSLERVIRFDCLNHPPSAREYRML